MAGPRHASRPGARPASELDLLDELARYDERPEEVEMNTEPTTEMSPEELADARRQAWGGLGCLLILAAFIVPPVLFVVFALLYALFGG